MSRDAETTSATAMYNIIRKWNLRFSGARGEDAETFLLRIEEGRELIPVADEDVLRCLPFFLEGIALHLFRRKCARLQSWSAFQAAWRTRFGDPDFQFALRNEIMRRTQEEQESVRDVIDEARVPNPIRLWAGSVAVIQQLIARAATRIDYLTCLTALFDRLSPP